jgi:hypothetical protein
VPYTRAHSRASSGELSRSWGHGSHGHHTPRLSSSSGAAGGPGPLYGRRPERPLSASSGAPALTPQPMMAS